eukprot:sb/3470554/
MLKQGSAFGRIPPLDSIAVYSRFAKSATPISLRYQSPEYNTGTLAKVLRGEEKTDNPLVGRVELFTKSTQFISYAKTGTWGYDLYHDLVAMFERTSLVANTWQNGAGVKLPSDCSPPYNVWNTAYIEILGVGWSSSKDHSKNAISYTEGETPEQEKVFLVCIGDINRVAKQMERAGGRRRPDLSALRIKTALTDFFLVFEFV